MSDERSEERVGLMDLLGDDYERVIKGNIHHIWCNFWMAGPVEKCKMCLSFYEKYPMTGEPNKMMEKHFPENVKRGT